MLRGVRVYLTLNTMVREDEFPRRWRIPSAPSPQAGADAVLVQDLGVARARAGNRAQSGAARQHADGRAQPRRARNF